ncbi:MAG: hypothetical protein H7A12_06040 [Pseudomonadales bacterium]|jgi:hypothetical protein|nr:hypothetical protein [Pseudomonadales bacterium]MCP5337951.1 hypothetical protein [Pseudomonadales bacterium]
MRTLYLLILSLFLIACAGGTGSDGSGAATAYQGSYDSRLADKTQYGRLVIATVNLGKPSRTYLTAHEAHVDRLVTERLTQAGYQVLPSELFAEAWKDGVRKWGEPYNPGTGKLNETVLQYVLAETANALATGGQVQAIVFTNLEETQVYFSPSGNHSAHFLGVTRRPAARGGDGVPADFDWIQGVDAVGLYVSVFDLKLQRLFSGAGGIEVTEYLNLKPSKPVWTREKTVLNNAGWLEEGIDLALKPWIPR